MDLIQQQIDKKKNDYINIKNSVKILEKFSNWNGYLKIYTEIENNFMVGDIVYITYTEPEFDSSIIYNLDNMYDYTISDYSNNPINLEFGFGYKILYVNKFNNEVVINKYYNDIDNNLIIKNQELSKVSCRGGNFFNSISDGVTYYNCNFFNGEFGTLSGVISGSTGLLENAMVLCNGLYTLTDSNGYYSFDIPLGFNIIKIKANSHITYSIEKNILKENTLNTTLSSGENSITINSFGIDLICVGETINFFSNTIGYNQPVYYQWKINDVNVGSNNYIFSYNKFKDDDVVYCEIRDDFDILFGTSTKSNEITIQIIPESLQITQYPYPVNSGDTLTFVATKTCIISTNYQWRINERVQSETSNKLITNTLNDGDEVYCILDNEISNKITVNFI